MQLPRIIKIFCLLFIFPITACSKDSAAFVRVNQLGYQVGHSARAYLMTREKADGGKFTVNDAQGNSAFSGTVTPTSQIWGKYKVYVLDFTATKSGTYSINVTGAITATSPQFRIDSLANLYSSSMTNALSFYQNQRDGRNFIPSDLRTAPAHLNDKSAKIYQTPEFEDAQHIRGDLNPTGAVRDVSGGWTDAGDYLKFVHTTSYVVALMLTGLRDFPNQMGPGSPSDFTAESKFGLDWLLQMWDDDSRTLYYQVGIGSAISGTENDHSIWRLPQDDDNSHVNDPGYRYIRNRPAFIAGPAGSKISPNLAGRLAADFALCYQVFRATDAPYANRCLDAAAHLFDLADTAPSGPLLTAAPFDFYSETQWHDDLEFAAVELYLATRSGNTPKGMPHDAEFYLQSAAQWAALYIRDRGHETGILEASDVSALAHFDLYRALAGEKRAAKLAVTQPQLLADLRQTLDRAAAQSAKDPFGFGISWGEGDTPARGQSLAIIAKQYDYLTKAHTFSDFSERWMANSLGANPWGISFIVGDGAVFPHCIHHQVANLVGSANGQKPILAGAVVEGPIRKLESGAPWGVVACRSKRGDPFEKFNSSDAIYVDDVKVYSTNEPAIDLSASSFLLFAWQMAGEPAH